MVAEHFDQAGAVAVEELRVEVLGHETRWKRVRLVPFTHSTTSSVESR